MSKLEESAFGLSQDELEQIKYSQILKRRKESRTSKRFSDFLSPEAQIAMQLALEDTQEEQESVPKDVKHEQQRAPRAKRNDITSGVTAASGRKLSTISEQGSENSHDSGKSKSLVKNPSFQSFAELYENNSIGRMEGDITDENYDASAKRKRALNGGKVESAMEIVENVFEGGATKETDEFAIDEIAISNSVEKCVIWMEFGEIEEEKDPTDIME